MLFFLCLDFLKLLQKLVLLFVNLVVLLLDYLEQLRNPFIVFQFLFIRIHLFLVVTLILKTLQLLL